jgi:hypothetical protein
MPNTPANRFLAAHRALDAHGVHLDGHDLTLEQMEAIAAIADRVVSPAVATAQMAEEAA